MQGAASIPTMCTIQECPSAPCVVVAYWAVVVGAGDATLGSLGRPPLCTPISSVALMWSLGDVNLLQYLVAAVG
jgi:hypothetical protein